MLNFTDLRYIKDVIKIIGSCECVVSIFIVAIKATCYDYCTDNLGG